MALSNAERQRRYRQRRRAADDGEGEWQINTWVRAPAYFGLRRLAAHYGVTQRDMLERLIVEADKAVINGLEPDTPGWDTYFGRPLSTHDR